ncbi:MAG: helix-turn-helix domain-containing protein [Ilumatobacteraceae bacterium]
MEPSDATQRVNEVESVESLKAYVHPLRLTMLGLLRRDGPASASELGRRIGQSSGSTSYHLRQLERFGFVEPAPIQPNRRTKRWQATAQATTVAPIPLLEDPAGSAIVEQLVLLQLDRLRRQVTNFARRDEPAVWWDAAMSADNAIHLDPTTLREFRERILAVHDEFRARRGTPGRRNPRRATDCVLRGRGTGDRRRSGLLTVAAASDTERLLVRRLRCSARSLRSHSASSSRSMCCS